MTGGLSEDAAHRVLARAVELDARESDVVSLAQLREIAQEAGIAPEALERALAEARDRPERRWRGAIGTNAAVFVAFWILLRVANRVSGALDLDWPAQHAGLILANVLGLVLALRARARAAALVLGVTAAAMAGEYPPHLLFGVQTVQGGPTKWALMLTGLLGIGVGAVIARRRTGDLRSQPSTPINDHASAIVAATETANGDAMRPPASLRLRAV